MLNRYLLTANSPSAAFHLSQLIKRLFPGMDGALGTRISVMLATSMRLVK